MSSEIPEAGTTAGLGAPAPRRFERYVAIGDSTTEGLDDPDGQGGYRGWANRLAERIADLQGGLLYANLAVRGRRTRQIREEQLEPALALRPDLATISAGTNDLLRPRFDADAVAADVEAMARALAAQGAKVLGFNLPDLRPVMPLARLFADRARRLAEALKGAAARSGMILLDFHSLPAASDSRLWSEDRLHANALGHELTAEALAHALGLPGSDERWAERLPPATKRTAAVRLAAELRWLRRHLAPWVWRHLQGRSSGDGRACKRPELRPFPEEPHPSPPAAGGTERGEETREVEELAAYHQSAFDLAALGPETRFPLPDEPFVVFWEEVVSESAERGAWAALSDRLPQLAFPVRAGISQTEPYRDATRRGTPVASLPEATGLELPHPEALELELYASPAGRIPLLVVRRREEFVLLLQALARKNEPEPIADAQGALMVSGYNNWCRIGEHRRRWEARLEERRKGGEEENDPETGATSTWDEEFRRLQTEKDLYQDRFILLSDGPYSAVPAADLGLAEEEWRRLSLRIRRDHECSHYLTRRLFGSMRNHLLDELMADYAGLCGAIGRFRADWFLRFLGLEDFPRYREGGRLDLYRGNPPLGDAAFRTLQGQVRAAAFEVELFDAARPADERGPLDTAWVLAAMACLQLDELAGMGGAARLGEKLRELQGRAGPSK